MAKNNNKKVNGYRSEIDLFFHNFDDNRDSFPESRQKEINKHEKIFAKRDKSVEEPKEKIWNKF